MSLWGNGKLVAVRDGSLAWTLHDEDVALQIEFGVKNWENLILVYIFCFQKDGIDILSPFLLLNTVKTLHIMYKTNIRRLCREKRQTNHGSEDVRNDTVVSSLGFLFA